MEAECLHMGGVGRFVMGLPRLQALMYEGKAGRLIFIAAGMTKAQAMDAIARGWDAGRLALVTEGDVLSDDEGSN